MVTKSKEFSQMSYPLGHYIPLWILGVFTLVMVCVSTMGGFQVGFARRDLPSTSVSGDLNVDGEVKSKSLAFSGHDFRLAGGSVTTQAISEAEVTGTIELESNRVYLSSWVGAGDVTIALPEATEGNLVTWSQVVQLTQDDGSLGFIANGDDTFDSDQPVKFYYGAAGPNIPGVGSLLGATPLDGDSRMTLATGASGANSVFGGIGSSVMFYCKTAGVWSVSVETSCAGNCNRGAITFSQ